MISARRKSFSQDGNSSSSYGSGVVDFVSAANTGVRFAKRERYIIDAISFFFIYSE